MSRRISLRSILFDTPIIEKMTLGSSAFAIRPLKRPRGKPQAPGPPRLLERQEDARPLVLPRRVRALRKEEAFGRDVARVDQAVSHALGAFGGQRPQVVAGHLHRLRQPS